MGPGLVFVLLCLIIPALGQIKPDTDHLRAVFEPYQKHETYRLSGEEYRQARETLLTWLDQRVTSAVTVDDINQELSAARLILDGTDGPNFDVAQNHAGFLSKIERVATAAADDVLALRVGMYLGNHCVYDDMVVLYDKESWRRRWSISPTTDGQTSFRLAQFALAPQDEGYLTGSVWIVSSCSSVWNGVQAQIDRLDDRGLQPILARSLGAKNDEPFRIHVEKELVEFRFSAPMGDTAVLTRQGIAIYRVRREGAHRASAIATQYAGFVSAWLALDENELPSWTDRNAQRFHAELAAKHGFTLVSAQDCPGPPNAIEPDGPSKRTEIGIRWQDSGEISVFQISGRRASTLRLLSISDRHSPGCEPIDPNGGFESILQELPR